MEPHISKEGFEVLQDFQKSRQLINDYYTRMGYTIVSPVPKATPKPSVSPASNKREEK